MAAGREKTVRAGTGSELDRDALAERSRAVEDEIAGLVLDSSRRVSTYQGPFTMHGALERCTWHTAQHTRQLAMALEGLSIAPDRPLGSDDLSGLPVPEKIWDD